MTSIAVPVLSFWSKLDSDESTEDRLDGIVEGNPELSRYVELPELS